MAKLATPAILGVILAGGLGRRMGGVEKALVPLAGKPLAAHVAARLQPQLQAGRLVLNANGPPGSYASLGLPVIRDRDGGRPGPLGGLLAAIDAAQGMGGGVAWVLSAPTDAPFLPHDLAVRLWQATEQDDVDVVLARSPAGLCQVCGLWRVSLAAALAQTLASGHNTVMAFAERQRWRAVDFGLGQIGTGPVDPFFNLNTPADVAWSEQLLSGGQA